MPAQLPSLVAVGPWEHGEFAVVRTEADPDRQWPTVATLSDVAASFTSFASATDALKTSSPVAVPEVILLAQPTPGEDHEREIERLRVEAPLARIVCIAGTWCEGELRTGHPPEGVVRLYWYEFAPWWRAAVDAWQAGRPVAWSEPLDDPRAGQQTPFTPVVKTRPNGDAAVGRTLMVSAADVAVFETLSDVLTPFDWRCVWRRPHLQQDGVPAEACVAAIWDGGQLSDRELQSLILFTHSVRASSPPAPIIALLDFPRAEHFAIAQSAGTTAVLGKPYQLSQLVNELERLSTPMNAG